MQTYLNLNGPLLNKLFTNFFNFLYVFLNEANIVLILCLFCLDKLFSLILVTCTNRCFMRCNSVIKFYSSASFCSKLKVCIMMIANVRRISTCSMAGALNLWMTPSFILIDDFQFDLENSNYNMGNISPLYTYTASQHI
jgi:hypothetical protein